MTDVQLAYYLSNEIQENKKSVKLYSDNKEINLICLSNKHCTFVYDLNTKEVLYVTSNSEIEDIVDFTYMISKNQDLSSVNAFIEEEIKSIVVEKKTDDKITLEVDSHLITLDNFWFNRNIKESDILKSDLTVDSSKTVSKTEEMQSRLSSLLNR